MNKCKVLDDSVEKSSKITHRDLRQNDRNTLTTYNVNFLKVCWDSVSM